MPRDREHPKDEAEFRRFVMAAAREHGWKLHTDPDLRMRMGDRGFPDLVLARDDVPGFEDSEEATTRVLFRELKMPGKYLNPDQWDWEQLLKGAGLDHEVWYPTQWDKIEETLR